MLKPSDRHSSTPAGALPKTPAANSVAGAEAQYESRFAEVTRKSREARSRLDQAQRSRETRNDAVNRDRDFAAPLIEETEAPPPEEKPAFAAKSAVEKAAALLDGGGPATNDDE